MLTKDAAQNTDGKCNSNKPKTYSKDFYSTILEMHIAQGFGLWSSEVKSGQKSIHYGVLLD